MLSSDGGTARPRALAVLRSETIVRTRAMSSESRVLTLSIPGKQERVPLRGVAGPLAKFETACFRSR